MKEIFILIIFSVALGFSTISKAEEVSAQNLSIGKLSSEYCTDHDQAQEFSSENQRYWYPRIPPYVGYSQGERTTAGGDGTCYLGYPKAESDSAVVMINSKIIEVTVTESTKGKAIELFKSKDGEVTIELTVIGNESTCVPDADTCCGDYTYATITVIQNNKKTTVNAAKYEGG